jgi:hypothetical protein
MLTRLRNHPQPEGGGLLRTLFALLVTVDFSITAGVIRSGWPTYLEGHRLGGDTIHIQSIPVPLTLVDIVMFSAVVGLHLLLPYLWYRNLNSSRRESDR